MIGHRFKVTERCGPYSFEMLTGTLGDEQIYSVVLWDCCSSHQGSVIHCLRPSGFRELWHPDLCDSVRLSCLPLLQIQWDSRGCRWFTVLVYSTLPSARFQTTASAAAHCSHIGSTVLTNLVSEPDAEVPKVQTRECKERVANVTSILSTNDRRD